MAPDQYKGPESTKVKGELEIQHGRGVIYFHGDSGVTLLRIRRLPKPIRLELSNDYMLDITHMHGTNWKGEK